MKRKIISLSLVLFIFLAMLPAGAAQAAGTYSDTAGHWAEAAIERWSDYGVLLGSGGRFNPNATITKAQLAAVLNRVLRYPDVDENPYKDVSPTDWFYKDMLALSGSSVTIILSDDGYANPNKPLERGEAVYMIRRAFGIETTIDGGGYVPFTDDEIMLRHANVRSAAIAMRRFGFIRGHPDGSFRPFDMISRAEVVTILNNMIETWINEPGEYTISGTGNILISCGNVNIIDHNAEYIFISPGTKQRRVEIHTKERMPRRVFAKGWSDHNIIATGETGLTIYHTFQKDQEAIENIKSEFASGSGTENDPLIIRTQHHLELLSPLGKAGAFYYRLGNDLDLEGRWRPISPFSRNNTWNYGVDGTPSDAFPGHLDGNGHTIRGLTCVTINDRAGLIANLSGSVKNLNIEAEINLAGTSTTDAGAIAGRANGTIENCRVTVSISGNVRGNAYIGGIAGHMSRARIIDCFVDVKIDASTGNNYLGGIVGIAQRETLIQNCEVNADITVAGRASSNIGGIAGGLASSRIENSTSRGNIKAINPSDIAESVTTGGIAGTVMGGRIRYITGNDFRGMPNSLTARAEIIGCMSSANIYAEGGHHSSAGGITGFVTSADSASGDGNPDDYRGYIISSCATGSVEAAGAGFQNNAGGLTGQLIGGAIVRNCWASGDVTVGKLGGIINVAGGLSSGVYEGTLVENSFAVGSVSEYSSIFMPMVGGLTGRLEGEIKNCYAIGSTNVIDADGRTQPYNFIVGSRRGEGGRIVQCADLTGSVLIFIDEPPGRPYVTANVTPSQVKQAEPYTSRGWDFSNVWRIPGSGYNLPVLRGVFENLQSSLAVPRHLS